ncbi:MAG TPA: helix-turn-helix transcriptional regulator [Rhizomicrobium sp.]|jgi:phage repressor protein C with HTH and peptisase S24 domain|nr:helix-turn-helix transcriptional regulator [Rhizomicrobium sp.]
MLTHPQIWRALDMLADRNGLSPSGLAKLAGLDPTTFNKSKRGGANGKLRWPSTESLAKVLAATGANLDEFVALASGNGNARAHGRAVPLIGLAQAGQAGYFDDAGFPAGGGWDEITVPDLADAHAYALEITGESMLPVYRDGDRVLVSPSGSLRRGDRVVARTRKGEVMAKQLGRYTAHQIELKSFNPAHPDRHFLVSDIAFVHRIIWVSQ